MKKGTERVIIENVKPEIENGKFPVKRVVMDKMHVTADIFCDGHDLISADILWKKSKEESWTNVPMEHLVNDEWVGEFLVPEEGIFIYTIYAWVDEFKSWHRDILRRIEAENEQQTDFLVGAELIVEVLKSQQVMSIPDKEFLDKIEKNLRSASVQRVKKIEPIISWKLLAVMGNYPVRKNLSFYEHELEVHVERPRAGFSSWYEIFPRSAGKGKQHGTFRDVINRLPYIAEMGFDVLYFPPVHPIGETKRKGKNNSVTAKKGEPGSPWAIGNNDGGHKALHPELGRFEDFEELQQKAAEYGIEIALDIAFQCSPDHPYLQVHSEWFRKRHDGSIQYAENPPKKYEDIYPFDFETAKWEPLWEELKSIFLFWIEKGIKIFRVDNPHTKSLYFWGWAINEIRTAHPDTIFLSEAFTRPKVMYQLAKQGFTQSYTYFTWRNSKEELTEYMEELVKPGVVDFFRPNLWPNTPDILPEYLQVGGRSGFLIRLILAGTLSSNYGLYGPAFELMEHEPKQPGSEEYLNSEKYEIKDWNLNERKSLHKNIALINRIRRENPALQRNYSLRFHQVNNDQLICYSKHTDDFSNIILTVVNLDPYHKHSGWIYFPVEDFGIDEHSTWQVHDLISGSTYLWTGAFNYVELDPGIMPVHVFRIKKKIRSEKDFDYFM